jgi:predicted  nucleic acid-binding Zn-ribbon protein
MSDENNEVQTLIDKVTKKYNVKMWLLGAAGLLILTPLIWSLAYAVLGLAALGVSLGIAGAVGLAIIYVTPVVTMKLKNKQIEMIIAEATKNPIPTMRAEWEKDGEEIEAFRNSIVKFDTAVEAAKKQVDKLSVDMDAASIAEFQADYEMKKADVAAQYEDLAKLEAIHRMADSEIKRLNAIWESANAMNKAGALNMGTRRLDAISAIKRDAAFNAVVEANATAKAQMRARMEQRKAASTQQLANNASPVLGVIVAQKQGIAQ